MGKPHSSYTVSDMKRLDLSFLKKDKTDEQIARMRSNMDYLGDISNQMGHTSFGGKPFLDLFGDKPFYEYDERDINGVIAESIKAEKERMLTVVAKDEQLGRLENHTVYAEGHPEDVHDYFKSRGKHDLENRLSRCEEDIEGYATRIGDLHREIGRQQNYIRDIHKEIEDIEHLLTKASDDPVDQEAVDAIKQVIAGGDWVYLGTHAMGKKIKLGKFKTSDDEDDSYINSAMFQGHLFLTSKPIICTYINSAANVSMKVDFGHFLVSVDKAGHIKRACPVINSLGTENHAIHPHLSSTSSICWGNARYKYSDLTAKGMQSLPLMLSLFKSLMETYCPDNPYRPLKGYYRYVKRRYDTFLPLALLLHVPLDIVEDQELRTRLALERFNLADALVVKWFDYMDDYGYMGDQRITYLDAKVDSYVDVAVREFLRNRIAEYEAKILQSEEEARKAKEAEEFDKLDKQVEANEENARAWAEER